MSGGEVKEEGEGGKTKGLRRRKGKERERKRKKEQERMEENGRIGDDDEGEEGVKCSRGREER